MTYFGLTGGIASGKSTVAGMFRERGARVIDADQIGHDLLRSAETAYQEVVQHFGPEVLDSSGEVNRLRLGARVFADRAQSDALNAILHPRIIARVEVLARDFIARAPRAVILVDAALIFEAGIGARFRKVIVTWCRPEQQLARLLAKGLPRQEAERRIAAQMPIEEKRSRADYVIDCSGNLEETRRQTDEIYAELLRLAGSSD
jgi:dephospho-CoA kinase